MLERSLPCLLNTLPLRWWGVMATLALYILGAGFSHYVEIILPKGVSPYVTLHGC